jgi:hypothetical protein
LAEGAVEVGFGEGFGGGAEGDGAGLEKEGLVEKAGSGGEVVVGGDDQPAFVGEFL